MQITEPGFYDLTPEEYYPDPCPEPSLTQSGIRLLVPPSPPEKFARRHPRLGNVELALDKAHHRRGSVVHRMSLGRGRDYRVGPFKTWAAKGADAFKAECKADGVTPVKALDMPAFEAMARRARAALEAWFEGRAYDTEVALVWREETSHGPIWCRGLVDAWCPALGRIGDLKITGKDASEEAFQRGIVAQGFGIQNRWYTRGVERLVPRLVGRVKFATIIVEADDPYCHQAHDLLGEGRALADSQISVAVDTFARCLKASEWPGYASGVRKSNPPPWAFKSWFDDQAEEAA